MKRRAIVALAALGAIALSVAAVQSQPGDWGGPGAWEADSYHGPGHWEKGRDRHSGRGPGGGMHGMEMAEALGLSDEQLQEIKSIRLAAAKEIVRKQADIRIAQIDMRALMDEGEEDRHKIHQQIEAVALLQAAVRILQVDQRLDIRAQLTEEQRQIFEKMHRERGPGRRHGPHGMDRGEGKRGRRHWRSMEGEG